MVFIIFSFGSNPSVNDDIYSVMSKSDTYLHNKHSTAAYLGAIPKKNQTAHINVNSLSAAHPSYDANVAVLEQAVVFPNILIGWRIDVAGYGTGLILSVHKKRFRPTHFKIQMDGSSKIVELPLQRSAKKGIVPFKLLSKIV